MYNNLIPSSKSSRFFNFRENGGLIVNRVTDIPYDFYALMPGRLQPLYRSMMRSRQWENGYVPDVHSRLLSSNIVQTLNRVIVDKVVGSGYNYDGNNDAVTKINEWDKYSNFKNTIEEAFYGSSLLGFAFIKNDIVDGRIVPRVINADQIFYEERFGEVIDSKTVVAYVTGNNVGGPMNENSSNMKLLMEHRYYDKSGNKKIRHFFTSTNTQFSQKSSILAGFTVGDRINPGMLKDFGIDVVVGQNFKQILKDEHGIFLDPIDLPLKNGLGVFMVKGTIENSSYLKQDIGSGIMAQVGEDNLIKYELANSLETHELNIAPQIVIVPTGYDNGTLSSQTVHTGDSIRIQNRPLDKTYFTRLAYGGEDTNSEPKAVEFTIRSNDIISMKNSALREIALAVQLKPSDIGVGSEKAVYESDSSKSKTDITTSMINRRRRLASDALRNVINEVCFWEGISDPVDMIWTQTSGDTLKENAQTVIELVKGFLMSTKMAVDILYPNMTPSDREQLLLDIDDDRQNIINTYYGGYNQNNSKKEKTEIE